MRTKGVIRNAMIDVIQKGRRSATEWNVKVVMQMKEQYAASRRTQPRRSRRVRKKIRPLQTYESK